MCSIKKAVLKKFRNIYRKTPALESLFNKVTGLKACEYCEIFKTTYFEEYLRRAASVTSRPLDDTSFLKAYFQDAFSDIIPSNHQHY